MFDEAKVTAFYLKTVKQVINTAFTAKGLMLLNETLGVPFQLHVAKNYCSDYFSLLLSIDFYFLEIPGQQTRNVFEHTFKFYFGFKYYCCK